MLRPNNNAFRLILLGGFLLITSHAWAFLDITPATIEQGLNKFANDFFTNSPPPTPGSISAGYVVSLVFKGLANACFAGMVYVYNKIGTILIPIPDLASASTYVGVAGNLVHNIYGIMVVLGVFVGLAVFIAYAGILASGLGGRELTATAVARLVVAMSLMVAWPTLYSFFNQMATSAGYLIFGQNNATVVDVLMGINNLDQSNVTYPSSWNGATPSAFSTPRDALNGSMNNVIVVIKMLGILLCTVGIMYGGYRFSTGDPHGLKILAGALIGIPFILGAEQLAAFFLDQAQPLQTLTQSVTGNPTTNLSLPNSQVMPNNTLLDYTPNSTAIMGSVLKIIVSLWGLFICIGVLLAKFFQVASLIVIFFLGPIFCGLTASPHTEHIAKQGFLLMLRYQLYSIIWALALMVLYIIGSINFGAESLGVGNLLSAFAILAGLQLVQKSESLANIFTHVPGAGVSFGSARDTWSSFTRVMIAESIVNSFRNSLTQPKANGPSSGNAAQTAGNAASGAIGTAIPALGIAAGAATGRAASQVGTAAGFAANGSTGAGNYGGGNESLAKAVGDLASHQKSQQITSRGGRSADSSSTLGHSSPGKSSPGPSTPDRGKNPPRRT